MGDGIKGPLVLKGQVWRSGPRQASPQKAMLRCRCVGVDPSERTREEAGTGWSSKERPSKAGIYPHARNAVWRNTVLSTPAADGLQMGTCRNPSQATA
jgi:hypothetical protein